MHLSSTRRRLSVAVSAAALLGASLALAPAAQAAPVFVDAETELNPYSYADTNGTDCTVTPTGTDDDEAEVPVVENGPAATASTSVAATFANSSDPNDDGTATGSASATGKVTSVGGVLNTMDFSGNSTYTLTTTAGSACDRYGSASVDLDFRFTISQPGFLTLNMENRGTSYGEVYVYQTTTSGDDQPYVDNYGRGLKFNSDTRVFLPAGTYDGYFETYSSAYIPDGDTRTSDSEGGSTKVHAEFNVAGSQTAAPAGKGKRYVKFPASRNCAAHTLTPTITEKAKRAKKIQSVKFFVNGTKVKKVRDPSKGQAVVLTVADDQDADVRALVKLEKVKKGVPAKKHEVTSSYIACS